MESERKTVSTRLIEKPDPENKECSLITKFMKQSFAEEGNTGNRGFMTTREVMRRCRGKPDELIEREIQDEGGDSHDWKELEAKMQQKLREVESSVWVPASSWVRDVVDNHSDWFDGDRWFFSRIPSMFGVKMPRVYIEWDDQSTPEEVIQEWDPYEKRWKHTNREELQKKWKSNNQHDE